MIGPASSDPLDPADPFYYPYLYIEKHIHRSPTYFAIRVGYVKRVSRVIRVISRLGKTGRKLSSLIAPRSLLSGRARARYSTSNRSTVEARRSASRETALDHDAPRPLHAEPALRVHAAS